jgi:hypothetical protein
VRHSAHTVELVRRKVLECLIQGLRLVTPCTQRIDRLIDLLEQICNGSLSKARSIRSTRVFPLVLGVT